MSTAMNFEQHFQRSPEVCGGALVVRGTRIPVRMLLADLAEGSDPNELLSEYPTLKPEDVRAVVAYAASKAFAGLSSEAA